jgi:hypothetical protein
MDLCVARAPTSCSPALHGRARPAESLAPPSHLRAPLSLCCPGLPLRSVDKIGAQVNKIAAGAAGGNDSKYFQTTKKGAYSRAHSRPG